MKPRKSSTCCDPQPVMHLTRTALLLAMTASPALTQTSLDWAGLRTSMDQGVYRPQVLVRTGPAGGEQIKGKVFEITDTAIVLYRQRIGETAIDRDQVHSVRVRRASGNPRWRRNVVAITAVPIAIGAFFLAYTWGGTPEGGYQHHAGRTAMALGASVAVPVAVYRLAWKRDVGKNAVWVVLDKGK